MSAFFQTDAGGWSYDIPEREDDETPDLDRSLFANRGTSQQVPMFRNKEG